MKGRRLRVGDRVVCYVRNEPWAAPGTVLQVKTGGSGCEATIRPDHKPAALWYLNQGAMEGCDDGGTERPE
jgi:hypothetical protein